jgi:membrane associated rhomboid family serine protease
MPNGELHDLAGFWPWQLVTYGFLHSTSSFMHIGFNMFILWMLGVQVESVWGTRRFATYYFVCVIGAGILQLIVASLSNGIYPTLGASGGVMGILLAFGMLFPNQEIYLYFLIPVKAKWLVVGLAVFELFAGVSGTQPGVANFAHLGGMLFGFMLILYWRGKLPIRPEHPLHF